MYINILRGDSVNRLFGSLLRLNFDVLHAATNNRYIDGDIKRLANLGLFALFIIYKLASSSGKHIEEVNHAHTVCLMYKLITSCRESAALSIGFDRDRNRRQWELTNNKNQKGKYHVTIMPKEIFVLLNTRKKEHTD